MPSHYFDFNSRFDPPLLNIPAIPQSAGFPKQAQIPPPPGLPMLLQPQIPHPPQPPSMPGEPQTPIQLPRGADAGQPPMPPQLGRESPQMGFGGKMTNYLANNPASVWTLASGLMGGDLAGAMARMPGAIQADRAVDKPETTGSLTEYARAREQGFQGSFMDYKRVVANMRAPSPAPSTTVTVGGQKIPPVLVKEAVDASGKADTLEAQVVELSQFREMAMTADTGWFAPATLPIKQAFQQLGVPIADDVPLLEAMRAQQNLMALRLRNPDSGFGLTGNTSDRDVTFLKDSVAGIEKTPEGNRAVLTIMMAKQRREAFLSRAKAEYIFQTGSLAGWGDFKKGLVDQTPFFEDDEAAFISSLGQPPPTITGIRRVR